MLEKNLGHYRVLEKIGEGGMGEVYRARDTKLDRDVAIKVLPDEFAQDDERLARFERHPIVDRWFDRHGHWRRFCESGQATSPKVLGL